ncbi:tetratricopeptide repeat protein [Mannheimia pernigra]|uniref:Sel1 repeat family protein n=1 Tax=Mannheimia pernigra TaxID=111844 RepID=A0A7D5HWT6_9PAST|nr:tetratricopeptide repeat protein [Mannheimia pernigra]QLB40550.1 sel1 repeat family protein [Mannheimia pernigra]
MMKFKTVALSLLLGLTTACSSTASSEKAKPAEQAATQQNDQVANLIRLAEQGISEAQYNLGQMYRRGEGVAKNDKQAVYWYQKAAEQGNTDAQYNLGSMYYVGKGVAKNDKQAIYWYQKAAEQGMAAAQNKLGAMYFKGEGVQRDLSKAKQYFQLACNGGDQNGCENYTILNQQGVK